LENVSPALLAAFHIGIRDCIKQQKMKNFKAGEIAKHIPSKIP